MTTKQGRPASVKGRVITVHLADSHIDHAKKEGGGNVSKGLRNIIARDFFHQRNQRTEA